jgi:hypothetical protein
LAISLGGIGLSVFMWLSSDGVLATIYTTAEGVAIGTYLSPLSLLLLAVVILVTDLSLDKPLAIAVCNE